MSAAHTAHSKVWKVHSGNISRGLGLCGMTLRLPLSSGSTGCVLEAGAHDPRPKIHHGHPCAGGTAQMQTLQPSIKTSWVYALHVMLGMGLVGHAWCMQVHRSCLYAGQSAITTWISLPHHRSHLNASCISHGRGLAPSSPSGSLFAGYASPIYSAPPFMPSHGLFHGMPSSYWSNDDFTPLPAKAPPPLGESSNQGCSH